MIIRQNHLRGKILAFLRELYPDGVDESGVMSALYEYHKVEDIEESIAYLVDKLYVHRDDRPHPVKVGNTVHIYRITPSGIDLVDGLTTDPGVTRVAW